ncbi:MAG TPA: DUF2007 domain-containing protein [Allocoleopsis sp.]
MTPEIVTVATFADAIEAELAQQLLEAEDIIAFVNDEATVNLAWYLTIAVGWIKLQVLPQDAEAALSILIDAQQEGQIITEPSIETSTDTSSSLIEEWEPIPSPSWTDLTSEYAFRAAVLSLMFLPLQLYSLWLLLRLLVSSRRINPSRLWKVVIAAAINMASVTVLWRLISGF